jgi:hypothetical protein
MRRRAFTRSTRIQVGGGSRGICIASGKVPSPHDDVLEVNDDAGLISFVANLGGEPRLTRG